MYFIQRLKFFQISLVALVCTVVDAMCKLCKALGVVQFLFQLYRYRLSFYERKISMLPDLKLTIVREISGRTFISQFFLKTYA